MQVNDAFINIIIQIIPVFLMLIVLYYFFLYSQTYSKVDKKTSYNAFFSAVKSVLENCSENSDCSKQIDMHFKNWAKKHSENLNLIKNSVELLEVMVYNIDIKGKDEFERISGINLSPEERNRLVNIVEYMKKSNPFISISNKESNVLMYLKYALETKNQDLGNTMLTQLSNDIELLEMELKGQKEKNQKSYIISIIGIVLTVVFGLMSLVPYIFRIF